MQVGRGLYRPVERPVALRELLECVVMGSASNPVDVTCPTVTLYLEFSLLRLQVSPAYLPIYLLLARREDRPSALILVPWANLPPG